MNKLMLFYGNIKNVEKVNTKPTNQALYKLEIEVVEDVLNKETREYETKPFSYFIKKWKNLDGLIKNKLHFFVCSMEYRKVISKKAINKETNTPFEYGRFEFTIKEIFLNKEDAIEYLNSNKFANTEDITTDEISEMMETEIPFKW